MEKMIYLDNAATTFPKPESVYAAMDKVNREMCVNAGRGAYRLAREATKLIDDTKTKLVQLIHANSNANVIFSSSITIALNQVIHGIKWRNNAVIYVSPFDHNAVARTVNYLKKKSQVQVKILPLDKDTLEIDIEKMKYEFSKDKPEAVICTHVSNVIGYILPVKEIFDEAKKYDCITILDTAQSLGLIDVDVRTLKADIIAFAGHKTLYGPLGIGGFINVSNVPIDEYIVGGTGSDSLNLDMPQAGAAKYEAASSNIVAIAGLNAALSEVDLESDYINEKELTTYLIEQLQKIPYVTMYLPQNLDNHVGIVSFTVDDMKSEDVGMILDEDFNIAVRTGYHCAPYVHEYLGVEESLGTVRVGLGRYVTKDVIDELVGALGDII